MILGASHIVFGSSSLDRELKYFEAFGWQHRFVELGIKTFEGKRGFMCTSSKTLSLAFLLPDSGIGVELIQYEKMSTLQNPAPLQMVLNVREIMHEGVTKIVETILPGVYELCVEELSSPIWVSFDEIVPSLIVHHVTDLESASLFWESGLGFRRAKMQMPVADSCLLEFPAILPQWRARLLLLPRVGVSPPPLLDGPGFRVLSMVSTKIEDDRDRMFRLGGAIASTGIMELNLNRNNMLLDLVQGPDGVMVEIFQTIK